MRLNRDVAVLAARSLQSDFRNRLRIADPMTGSGVRGLRYAAGVENLEHVILNDIEPSAAMVAEHNSFINRLEDKVEIQCMDANVFLNLHSVPGKRLHIIDLDPYGSPVPYLDSALRGLVNNGLLAMTATDMAVLCGVKPRACLKKYGGRPLRSEYSREVALRLLYGSLIMSAARNNMAVEAKFSHSTDHYVRLYAKIWRSAIGADRNLDEMGYIRHCFTCLNRSSTTDSGNDGRCMRCEKPMTSAGPLFLGKLTDEDFCRSLIELNEVSGQESSRLSKLLNIALEEVDAPTTYFTVDAICDRIGLVTPSPISVIQALRTQGYVATRTHFDGRAFKTNAPIETIEASIRHVSQDEKSSPRD